VSLLFGVWFLANAIANKTAGELSRLYPPSGQEYTIAAAQTIGDKTYQGIDNDTYRGILDGTVQPTDVQKAEVEAKGLPLTYPSFLGSQVKDLYQFFIIFVGMAGVAGLILFGLSFPLRRMMHGAD